MAKELIIPFESFKVRGVQKNVIPCIQNSFFSNIYMQAFKLIEQIDKANENSESCNGQLNDFQNVIAFTGRRGTGKTSSMLSFMETLVSGNLKQDLFFERFSFKEKGFCKIPYTDASLMSKNEDIFKIVLSKMLSSLKREFNNTATKSSNNELELKKVSEKICNIYNNYSSLKSSTNFSSSAPYNYMEKLADKYNVREQFEELVKEFTNALSTFNGKKNIDYLIICIDDIDMSQHKNMNIMQCIHQYLMIPRVIVLVSFNVPMLTANLQADFHSNVSISNSTPDEHGYQMQITRNQTYDFMRKIIPADMRITMPSWKKKDYRELFHIFIDFSNERLINELFPEMEKCSFYKEMSKPESCKKITPKELIMLMLADRTGVYLDICGFKLHFMQPESLRELSDLFYLTYNMKFCNGETENEDEKKKDENCLKRRENRKILLDYLHFKMLPENNFSIEIERFIQDVLASPMERRGRIISDYYFKLLINKEHSEKIKNLYDDEFYKKEMHRYKIEDYSFGALYRALYTATRLNVLDRKVVIFLLASLSFSMPQFVESEKKKIKDSPENEIYNCKRLREAFRYSLIGTWCKELFGGKSVNLVIDAEIIRQKLNGSDKQKKPKPDIQDKIISNLIYAFMLCSRSTIHSIKVDINGKGHYVFDISADPTAFIVNSYAFEHRMTKTFIKRSDDKEPKNIINYIIEIANINSKKAKKICENTRKNLFSKKTLPSFLLKHTDLSYNVIKRVMSEMIYASDNNVAAIIKKPEHTEPFDIIQEFYKKLSNKLEKQDKKYFLEGKNSSFKNIFENNPVVSLFLKNECNALEENGIAFEFEGN